jgi:rfaE bifunctional protein kinase chain/domain
MSKEKKHIIIGDLILDRFIYGHVNRISPEAPSLVLDTDYELDIFGGSSNLAAHLCSLGHKCDLISAVGPDFPSILSSFNASFPENCTTHFFNEHDRITSVKTRLVSIYKLSHLLRYDRETTHDINKITEDSIFLKVSSLIENSDTILLIDYKKGVITPRLAKLIINLAKKFNKPVFVDTKCDDLNKFRGSSLIKPNKHEFKKILLRHAANIPMPDACYMLLKKLKIGCIVNTAGEDGLYAYTSNGNSIHVYGEKVEIKELSGAGDSVLAVLSYCFAAGYNFTDSLAYANRIAGFFVSRGAGYTAKIEHMNFSSVPNTLDALYTDVT